MLRVPKMARSTHSCPNFISFSRPASLYCEEYVHIYSRVCYNERMLQWTVFINNITMLQRTQLLQRTKMLQRKRRNTIGRRSTRVRMTWRAFPLWLQRQSSSLLSFVRFGYQSSSVICLFVQCIKVKWINFILFLNIYFLFCIIFFLFIWLCWMVTLL